MFIIDSCAIKLASTTDNSLQLSKPINSFPKIIGYNPQLDQSSLNLIPLKDVLPLKIKLLDFIMANLICNILETIKRDLETPNISIDKIMVIKDNYECGIPFIFSKYDNTTSKQCEDKLLKQFTILCQQLGYDEEFVNSNSLKQFQYRLLLRINFQQNALQANASTLLDFLKIKIFHQIHKSNNTELQSIEPPKFLLKGINEEQIAVKITKIDQEELYELREISIIEEFNNNHLPYLYGYLRYSEILIQFLRKHDYTFNLISKKLFQKRKEFNTETIQQFFYKLYRSMIIALNYVHSMDLVHRDLKPANIMFDFLKPSPEVADFFNTPFNCVLIDFDRSISIENSQTQKQSNYVGTKFYRPPEGKQNRYHSSYDIWQLGFMWFVMQKLFMYETKDKKNGIQNYLDSIKSQQTYIQEENDKIKELQKEISQLHKNNQPINENQNFLKIQMEWHVNKKKKLYDNLIKQIGEKENFINYDILLQNLIEKMIQLEPNDRANLGEIYQILDKLTK